MTTNVAVTAIRRYCKARGWKIIRPVRHIHTMAYVVGYAASQCLVIACAWPQSEKHLRDWDRKYPLRTVNEFDPTLKAGDWCHVGYVTTHGSQQLVAVPIKYPLQSKTEAKAKASR